MIIHKDIMSQVSGVSERIVRKVCAQLVTNEKIVRTRNKDKSMRYEFRDEDLPVILEAVAARQAEIEANATKPKKETPADPGAPIDQVPPADPAPPVDPEPPKEPDPAPSAKETLMDLVKRQGSRASVRPDRAKTPQAKTPEPKTAENANTWLWVGIGAVLFVIVLLAAWMARRRGASADGVSFNRPLPQGDAEGLVSSSDNEDSDLSWMPDSWEKPNG